MTLEDALIFFTVNYRDLTGSTNTFIVVHTIFELHIRGELLLACRLSIKKFPEVSSLKCSQASILNPSSFQCRSDSRLII